MSEPVTSWEFECTCGFAFEMPMLADDPTGAVAFDVAATHLGECGLDEDPE